MRTIKPLEAAMLRRRCDPGSFAFATTAELEDLTEIIGQARAVEAVRFGIGMRREGYNLFVLGPPGIGKHSLVRQFLEQEVVTKAPPPDWCYVNNFIDDARPVLLELPAGRGNLLRDDMQHLVDDLKNA
ncbi:MAG: AAA family ATPase, partial [Chloroflexi bacterium]|nr:AAA family ATPase [Chloroflexota bacterium]